MRKNNARTLTFARKHGWLAGRVEKYTTFGRKQKAHEKHAGTRGVWQDLFGFVDTIVIDDEPGALFVQSTGMDWKAHLRKMEGDPKIRNAIRRVWKAENRIEIWAWRKIYRKDRRGARRKMWWPKIISLGWYRGKPWIYGAKEGEAPLA